jgi:hypothetical protein
VARSGKKTSSQRRLAGNSGRKKPLRRPRNGWEDAIKMYLKKCNRRPLTGFRIRTDFGVLWTR